MRTLPLVLAIALLSAPVVLAQVGHDAHQGEGTLVDLVVQNEDLATLATAVQTAGLVEALAGEGPFTVFAPTNDAFAALPEGTLEALLAEEGHEQLTSVLLAHVVPGVFRAADLQDGQTLETLGGHVLTVSVVDGRVTVDGAEVVVADVEASNGVAHVIGSVIVPAPQE